MTLVAVTAILGLGAGSLALQRTSKPQPPRYQTETITRGQVTGVLHAPARLESTSTVRVGTATTGRVSSVSVVLGQSVRRGQVLARLDRRTLRAQTHSAEAQAMAAHLTLRQAEVRLSQLIFLLEHAQEALNGPGEAVQRAEIEGAAMDAEADLVTAGAALQAHTAAVATTRAQLSAAVLRAPLDGVVIERSVEPGETVTPGHPLFVIASHPKTLRLVASVGENDVDRVRSGPVTFIVPSLPDRIFRGQVTSIDPAPRTQGASGSSYSVRLLAANEERVLRPGMTALVALPLQSARGALLVPRRALELPRSGGAPSLAPSVHILDRAGEPRRVPVEVGVTDGNLVEVRAAGLQPGAAVVVAGRRS